MSASAALDTRLEVETPEGIRLHLLPAGVVPRALAWSIDLLIRLLVLWIAAMALAFGGEAGHGIYFVVLFAVLWLYPVLFELFWQGQTPGKRALSLRVLNTDGTPVGWVASMTRNLLRTVDMLPFAYGIGSVCSLFDSRSRRLGDLAAGTLVVHDSTAARAPMQAPPRLAVASVEPPPGLLRSEREALVEFAERHAQLSEERQIELANLLQPMSGTRGEAGVTHLLGVANSLLGQQIGSAAPRA